MVALIAPRHAGCGGHCQSLARAVVLSAALIGASPFAAGAQEQGGPAPGSPPKEGKPPAVDHSAYDALLKKYVNVNGMVDYKTWKEKDEPALRAYVQSLARIDPDTLDRSERLAFWINAYNALTIQGMLEYYPLKSIKDKVSRLWGFNIWKDYPMTVSGKSYSLNDIEHNVLRKMGEPRIHFAIVCASIGCPRLLNEAYTGERLDAQLDANAKHFFETPSKFRIDREKKTVYVSPILSWFGEDFGGKDRTKLNFIKRFVNEDDAKFLSRDDLDVKYLDYDWSLNKQ